jgi:alkylated DNA repair dioxygenase AlkB
MEKTELQDGGWVSYIPDFFNEAQANKLFQALKDEVPWKQETTSYGTNFPRLTSYYADEGVKYAYSGVVHGSLPWPKVLMLVRKRIEDLTNEQFNSLLLNYYRNGKDSIGWHQDNERELGQNPMVPSISLGAERTFHIRHKATKEKKTFVLGNGSLLLMGGTMQHHWEHSVPKTEKPVGERINLTFRNIK